MTVESSLAGLLGGEGPHVVAAMVASQRWLAGQGATDLLARVGQPIAEIPAFAPIDKRALPVSYGGDHRGPSDDFLTGRGLFYLSEQRRLFLDCTSGHYQMLWGYQHPALSEAIGEAVRAGVVWDNHSNIPQAPLKHLGRCLVQAANDPAEVDPLDKVLLGVCTGSVACAAALKIQLKVFEQNHGSAMVPVILSLRGNYHGSDLVPQFMRGLWPHLARPCELVNLEPNDAEALATAFRRYGERIAGFWAEPVMMNREVIPLTVEYLQLARRWCDQVGGLLCLDEIQTGFWHPAIFDYRALGVRPDLVVLGKGMTAGFHPLSGVLFRRRHDVLEQYDAISTNGSAALPAVVALASMELIRAQADRLMTVAARIESGFRELAAEFPGLVEGARGRGHLMGLRLKTVGDAKELHRLLLADGLWTRVHAYHEGHRTLLTKLGLLADEEIVTFVLARLRHGLRTLESRHPACEASAMSGMSYP
jgi:acetylornithine/succinyldiaminopimelate/putrescine aminotransferase